MPGALELSGQKFGRLLAVRCAGRSTIPGRSRIWVCVCDCGNDHQASANALRCGSVKSCGCLGTGPGLQPNTLRNAIISRMRSTARERGYSWNLSAEQVIFLMGLPCHWCEAPPSNKARRPAHAEAFVYSGIDRFDNSRGYEGDNVVPCCAVCNRMKRDLEASEFLRHITRIHCAHVAVPS